MTRDVRIIAILGGPGSGKGTQCALLQEKLQRTRHLSVGDLLRAEAKDPQSPYRDIILENQRLGRIGPKEITVGILHRTIERFAVQGDTLFILDGFPRSVEQGDFFETGVQPILHVIVLDCPDEVLLNRLSSRAHVDDDIDNIRRRIATFQQSTRLVIEKYSAQGKVSYINADSSMDTVSEKMEEVFKDIIEVEMNDEDTV